MGKLKAKDFIMTGILTLLFFIVIMICIFASAVTVVTYAFGTAIAAIPGGIIYMLMRAKTPKPFMILLSGTVVGLIEFFAGAGYTVAIGFIAGALAAELISFIGKYRNFVLNAIGYALYMVGFAAGTYLPMVIMSGYVDSMSDSNGVNADFMEKLHSFMSGPMTVAIIAATFVCALLGAFLGKLIFKKHFQKAGIV